LQHGRRSQAREAVHLRDLLVIGGDQFGLATVEEPHLDALRVGRALDEDLAVGGRALTASVPTMIALSVGDRLGLP
jgi:hypothetical protein